RLTRSDFKLTKRGSGSPETPLAGAGVLCADRPVAQVRVSSSAIPAARSGLAEQVQNEPRIDCQNHDLPIEIKPARKRHRGRLEGPQRLCAGSFVLSPGWPSVRQVSNFIARRRPRETGGRVAGLPASPYRARASMPAPKQAMVVVPRKRPAPLGRRLDRL